MATCYIPTDFAGGTIFVNKGDVFIVGSTATDNITVQSASGSPTHFSVEFNESNANVIDVNVQPNLTPTITIADGVPLGNTTIDARNADAANVTIGDTISLEKYAGSDAGADTVTIGNTFTTTNDFKTGAGSDFVYFGQNFSAPKIDTRFATVYRIAALCLRAQDSSTGIAGSLCRTATQLSLLRSTAVALRCFFSASSRITSSDPSAGMAALRT